MKFEEVLPKLREGYLAKPKRMSVWLGLRDNHFYEEPRMSYDYIDNLGVNFILDETWEIKE